MKRLAGVLVVACGLPFAAAAADFPAERIVAAASGDWNKDGVSDLALIVRPADVESDKDNGLYVYLANPDESRLELKLALPDTVWGGLTLYGQEPSLAALANGSFTLTTRNESVGRDRWRQSLTIAYRNNDFIVAGYTYASHDTLDPNGVRECDLNVLTGKGKSDGRAFAGQPLFAELKTWDDAIGRRACGLDD
ncbi:hypothetical protein [Shinella pollutisoli]|uniref:FG-GAP repeat-containing protein n=1 Tax=Shinella pollutisoli TaxID=2250594 RepID=A0ABV7DBB3_9HYPH|nr:hypothetical protein [Shinella pollutisoli]